MEKYRPRNLDYVEKRIKLLNNTNKFYDGREMIINAFEDNIFPLSSEEGLSEFVSRDEQQDHKQKTFYIIFWP